VAGSGQGGWQQQPQTYAPTVSAGPAPPSGYSAPTIYGTENGYSQGGHQQQQQQQPDLSYYQQQQPSQPGADFSAQSSTPQIHNPFPLPGQEGYGRGRGAGRDDYDPEVEAQIAQWQSAYAPKDESANSKPGFNKIGGNANAIPLGARGAGTSNHVDVGNAAVPVSGVAAVVAGADGKQKTVIRSGGGKSWQDPSLLEWDPSHPRLFIGNIAGEVTDDSLLKAFSKYASVQKARVIRDKRTTKSKGYGFVSFGNSDDYFQAAKEMQGKYIGSHPILIKRSTTEIKATVPQPKGKHGKGNTGGGNGAGADTGAGVQKKQAKKKGGLRILG
jgi:hypothetical protein